MTTTSSTDLGEGSGQTGPSPDRVPHADSSAQAQARVAMFNARVERWFPDLHAGLSAVYGSKRADAISFDLLQVARTAYDRRPDHLHARDLDRLLQPDWLQGPDMVGYACYTERFGTDLNGVAGHIDYLRDLGVTYLHLMPLLQPREGDNDGGYAVADYRAVRSDLGTMADLEHLATSLHGAGMSLVLDLVLNHVAREHEWARRARAGEQKYRDYFYVYRTRREPNAYERTLPEVFPDFAPGNFTYDEDLAGWVWTTFNEWQWDVNWSNPDVLHEYVDVILNLANAGVDVFRLDAIAFIWKRKGTDCQGQPEVHALTQVLRALAKIACPSVAFKAEAIVAPTKLLAYLGTGAHAGKVSDLAYHNSLMVQIWSMLAARDVRLAVHALAQLPPKPVTATWLTYLRCHDDIGWAIMDEDAAAVGLSGQAHRGFLAHWYSGDFTGSNATGLVFQYNPVNDDRRTSGTAASLVGLESAASRHDVERAVSMLRLAHALILGWGGIPVIWSGDELGQPNDSAWAEEEGHEDDNRWAHRPRLDWWRAASRHDRGTVGGRVYSDLVELIGARKRLPHLHASVETQIGEVDDPGVLVTVRHHPAGRFVGLYNVTPQTRYWPGHRAHQYAVDNLPDAITGEPLTWSPYGDVELKPYQVMWLATTR